MAENDFFTELSGTDKRTNIPSTISSPVWSGGATTLTSFYTGSAQSGSSGDYYYDVFDKVGTDTTREVQFAVAYGHFNGSGSLSTNDGNNPSKAVYRQFRNICIRNANSDSKFEFPENNTNVFKDIYVINVNRARYRERLDPGNWELHLGTGDPGLIKLIDDSGATSDSSVNASQRVFNVISGSIATGTAVSPAGEAASDFASSAVGSYGLFYPELGLIILNATRLDQGTAASPPGLALATVESAGTNDDNSMKLYNKLIIAGQGSGYFQSRREEQIKSSHFFCRVESDKYNWSQNPTYFDSTTTELTNTTFIQDPKAYITTVGLYNNNNELLAVAKLSQPLLKSRDREAVIKVRLDF